MRGGSKLLEDENRRLKQLVAQQALDKSDPQGAAGKRLVTVAARRAAVAEARSRWPLPPSPTWPFGHEALVRVLANSDSAQYLAGPTVK